MAHLTLRVIVYLVLIVGFSGLANAVQVESSFDFSRRHDFLGLGVQVWMSAQNGNSSASDDAKAEGRRLEGSKLLHDLNVKLVRVSAMPKIVSEELGTKANVDSVLALIAASDTLKQQAQFKSFAEQMRKLQIRPVLIFWRMPKQWTVVKAKKAGSRAESTHAKSEHIGDYASLVVAQIIYAVRHGIEPLGVELTNEPHGAWATKYENHEYALLVRKTRDLLDSHGLQRIAIVGPGTSLKASEHYLGSLKDTGSVKSLGYISAHVYLPADQLADKKTPGVAGFLGRGTFGPILITEFGIRNHEEGEEVVAAELDVDSAAYGVASAATAVRLLSQGAGGLSYWQLQDYSWSKEKHGLLTVSGVRRPVAYALEALFKDVPVNSSVAVPVYQSKYLAAVALQDSNRTFLMVVNSGNDAVEWTGQVKSENKHCGKVSTVSSYLNGKLDSGQAIKDIKVQQCMVKASIMPGAVATIVLE